MFYCWVPDLEVVALEQLYVRMLADKRLHSDTQAPFQSCTVVHFKMIWIKWKTLTIKTYLMSWWTTIPNDAVSSHSLSSKKGEKTHIWESDYDGLTLLRLNFEKVITPHFWGDSGRALNDAAVLSGMYLCCGFRVNSV